MHADILHENNIHKAISNLSTVSEPSEIKSNLVSYTDYQA